MDTAALAHFSEIKHYLGVIMSLVGVVVALVGLSARVIFSSLKTIQLRVASLEEADLAVLHLFRDRDHSLHREMIEYESRHGLLSTRISRVEWEMGLGERDKLGKKYQRRQIDQQTDKEEF